MDRNMQNFMATSVNLFSITNAFFTVIVMYFIYLYSAAQTGAGWGTLHFAAKIFLIISLIIVGLFVLLLALFLLAAFIFWLGILFRR